MRELYFDPSWNYRQLSLNLKTLRTQYRDILASFSYFQTKEMVAFKRQIKQTIYSYPFQEFLRNFAWDYLNLPEYSTENYDESR